jgi:hypothetical protein
MTGWSVSLIGKPSNVCDALDLYGAGLVGRDREDFDAVKPHLQALVRGNSPEKGANRYELIIHLKASGHGDSEHVFRQCQVLIEPFYTRPV